jgi:polar amino acid transport system permease protein
MYASAAKLDYNWQWYRIPRYLFTFIDGSFSSGPLLKGIWVTLKITSISLLFSCLFGLVAAIFRLSNSFAARTLSRAYLEFIRNTPLLVQIFFIYFVISPVLGFSRFTSAILALSFFEGAYASEIFRAGILSIHKGQWEAAYSIGLNRWNAYRHIILPQAVRYMLPPLASQAISLIKDSALVSTIAIYDLTMQGEQIIAETYMVFELWFIIAIIYLLMTATLSIAVNILEKRLAVEV